MNTATTTKVQAIEITIRQRSGDWILVGSVLPTGRISTSLTRNGHGTPHALSNLQSRGKVPTVAVAGWDQQLVVFAAGGLGEVIEVQRIESAPAETAGEAAVRIAAEVLRIGVLEAQGRDGLDFHEVAVWSVEEALVAAFEAGQRSVGGAS